MFLGCQQIAHWNLKQYIANCLTTAKTKMEISTTQRVLKLNGMPNGIIMVLMV